MPCLCRFCGWCRVTLGFDLIVVAFVFEFWIASWYCLGVGCLRLFGYLLACGLGCVVWFVGGFVFGGLVVNLGLCLLALILLVVGFNVTAGVELKCLYL